jgi:hypothetical protein
MSRPSAGVWKRGIEAISTPGCVSPTHEWHSLWEVKIHISELRERDDIVVALGRIQTRGEANGIDLDRPIAYVFEFDKGAARRVRSYFDQQQALEAAGLAN